jgi:hypothetical protein
MRSLPWKNPGFIGGEKRGDKGEEEESLPTNELDDLPEKLRRLPLYVRDQLWFMICEGEGQLAAGVAEDSQLYVQEHPDFLVIRKDVSDHFHVKAQWPNLWDQCSRSLTPWTFTHGKESIENGV